MPSSRTCSSVCESASWHLRGFHLLIAEKLSLLVPTFRNLQYPRAPNLTLCILHLFLNESYALYVSCPWSFTHESYTVLFSRTNTGCIFTSTTCSKQNRSTKLGTLNLPFHYLSLKREKCQADRTAPYCFARVVSFLCLSSVREVAKSDC